MERLPLQPTVAPSPGSLKVLPCAWIFPHGSAHTTDRLLPHHRRRGLSPPLGEMLATRHLGKRPAADIDALFSISGLLPLPRVEGGEDECEQNLRVLAGLRIAPPTPCPSVVIARWPRRQIIEQSSTSLKVVELERSESSCHADQPLGRDHSLGQSSKSITSTPFSSKL